MVYNILNGDSLAYSFPGAKIEGDTIVIREGLIDGDLSGNDLQPLVGFAEVLGGLLIIIPRTRALGALVLFPVMVGILLTNSIVETSGLPIAIAIWIIFTWIILENRRKYLPLLSK